MDPALPTSPSTAVRSLHSLRHRDLPRGGAVFPSDGDRDDERDDRRHFEQQQQRPQQRVPQSPPSPKPSLRRILEQRNLLPMRSANELSAALASPGADGVGINGVLDSRLPRMRLDHRMSRGHTLGLHKLPYPHELYRSTESNGGDGDGHDSSSSRQSFLLLQHLYTVQPLPVASASQSPAPRATSVSSQDSSNTNVATAGSSHSRRRAMTPEERRRARTCVIDGCNNYIVDNHRCFRHGGGKRCVIDGCNSSAKQLGLCWRHGGSVLCKVEGCTRGAKVKGLCWGHSGGKKKKKNTSVAVVAPHPDSSLDSTAGPRCIFDGCRKPAVLHSFCDAHSQEVVRPGYIFEL